MWSLIRRAAGPPDSVGRPDPPRAEGADGRGNEGSCRESSVLKLLGSGDKFLIGRVRDEVLLLADERPSTCIAPKNQA